MAQPRQAAAIAKFRELHASGCFVLPNPWDIGTAIYLQHAGFKALATTSAGFAFTRGLPDRVSAIPLEVMLGHIREIAGCTTLPVNADFQNGYADQPEEVGRNVLLCIETGVAGLSIEDATGDVRQPLYELKLAVERIRAARRAIDRSGVPIVLTARCEAWLVGEANPFQVARERLIAYSNAGADCLYAPGVKDLSQIADLVQAIAPKPLNVLVSASEPAMSVPMLSEAGVRRISVGSALARVAWGAFMKAAQGIASGQSFESFAGAASFADLNAIFAGRVEDPDV